MSRLRVLRGRSAHSVPLRSGWRWYQRWIGRRLFAAWRESYVLLENGDYFHLPAVLEKHGEQVLTKAVSSPEILVKFCRPGSTVIDVGANIGQWSVPMAKLVGESGKLLAFEPIPSISESLRKTLRINGLAHGEAHAVALSDVAGEATLYVSASDTEVVNSGRSSLEVKPPHARAVTVRTERLDEFLKNRNLPRVSFIKIDVEGHEARVLAGARETLRQHRPALVIETGHEDQSQRSAIALLLRELEYEPIGLLHHRHVAPADWPAYLAGGAPFGPGGVGNLLLLPA